VFQARQSAAASAFLLPVLVIASRTEPALRLQISRHPFEARREIQKVSSDVW